MKKQRFFVIKTKEYGSPAFYFQDLDGAMKMFKFLMEGNAVNIGQVDVDKIEKPDKDGYVSSEYLHYIESEPEYHLVSEIKNIYTKEEIEKIKKEREVKIKALKRKEKK